MGSKWFTGGVVAACHGRIQFDFIFNGIRYRPSIKRPPSEANLRLARERLEAIKHQIHLGTFSFEEEFPDYRFLRRLGGTSSARLCSDVFNAYLAHCEARLRRNDMAAATVRSYRKILRRSDRNDFDDFLQCAKVIGIAGYPQEFQDFMESIHPDRELLSGLDLARNTIATVHAAYLSAKRKGFEAETPT
jgi:hypothetical protein